MANTDFDPDQLPPDQPQEQLPQNAEPTAEQFDPDKFLQQFNPDEFLKLYGNQQEGPGQQQQQQPAEQPDQGQTTHAAAPYQNPTPLGSFFRGAAENLGPATLGSIGMRAGMGIGTALAPGVGTVAGAGIGLAAGLGLGYLGGMAGQAGQEYVEDKLGLSDTIHAQEALDTRTNPIASGAGELAAYLPSNEVGLAQKGFGVMSRLRSGVGVGAINAGINYATGNGFDPSEFAKNVAMGAIYRNPREWTSPTSLKTAVETSLGVPPKGNRTAEDQPPPPDEARRTRGPGPGGEYAKTGVGEGQPTTGMAPDIEGVLTAQNQQAQAIPEPNQMPGWANGAPPPYGAMDFRDTGANGVTQPPRPMPPTGGGLDEYGPASGGAPPVPPETAPNVTAPVTPQANVRQQPWKGKPAANVSGPNKGKITPQTEPVNPPATPEANLAGVGEAANRTRPAPVAGEQQDLGDLTQAPPKKTTAQAQQERIKTKQPAVTSHNDGTVAGYQGNLNKVRFTDEEGRPQESYITVKDGTIYDGRGGVVDQDQITEVSRDGGKNWVPVAAAKAMGRSQQQTDVKAAQDEAFKITSNPNKEFAPQKKGTGPKAPISPSAAREYIRQIDAERGLENVPSATLFRMAQAIGLDMQAARSTKNGRQLADMIRKEVTSPAAKAVDRVEGKKGPINHEFPGRAPPSDTEKIIQDVKNGKYNKQGEEFANNVMGRMDQLRRDFAKLPPDIQQIVRDVRAKVKSRRLDRDTVEALLGNLPPKERALVRKYLGNLAHQDAAHTDNDYEPPKGQSGDTTEDDKYQMALARQKGKVPEPEKNLTGLARVTQNLANIDDKTPGRLEKAHPGMLKLALQTLGLPVSKDHTENVATARQHLIDQAGKVPEEEPKGKVIPLAARKAVDTSKSLKTRQGQIDMLKSERAKGNNTLTDKEIEATAAGRTAGEKPPPLPAARTEDEGVKAAAATTKEVEAVGKKNQEAETPAEAAKAAQAPEREDTPRQRLIDEIAGNKAFAGTSQKQLAAIAQQLGISDKGARLALLKRINAIVQDEKTPAAPREPVAAVTEAVTPTGPVKPVRASLKPIQQNLGRIDRKAGIYTTTKGVEVDLSPQGLREEANRRAQHESQRQKIVEPAERESMLRLADQMEGKTFTTVKTGLKPGEEAKLVGATSPVAKETEAPIFHDFDAMQVARQGAKDALQHVKDQGKSGTVDPYKVTRIGAMKRLIARGFHPTVADRIAERVERAARLSQGKDMPGHDRKDPIYVMEKRLRSQRDYQQLADILVSLKGEAQQRKLKELQARVKHMKNLSRTKIGGATQESPAVAAIRQKALDATNEGWLHYGEPLPEGTKHKDIRARIMEAYKFVIDKNNGFDPTDAGKRPDGSWKPGYNPQLQTTVGHEWFKSLKYIAEKELEGKRVTAKQIDKFLGDEHGLFNDGQSFADELQRERNVAAGISMANATEEQREIAMAANAEPRTSRYDPGPAIEGHWSPEDRGDQNQLRGWIRELEPEDYKAIEARWGDPEELENLLNTTKGKNIRDLHDAMIKEVNIEREARAEDPERKFEYQSDRSREEPPKAEESPITGEWKEIETNRRLSILAKMEKLRREIYEKRGRRRPVMKQGTKALDEMRERIQKEGVPQTEASVVTKLHIPSYVQDLIKAWKNLPGDENAAGPNPIDGIVNMASKAISKRQAAIQKMRDEQAKTFDEIARSLKISGKVARDEYTAAAAAGAPDSTFDWTVKNLIPATGPPDERAMADGWDDGLHMKGQIMAREGLRMKDYAAKISALGLPNRTQHMVYRALERGTDQYLTGKPAELAAIFRQIRDLEAPYYEAQQTQRPELNLPDRDPLQVPRIRQNGDDDPTLTNGYDPLLYSGKKDLGDKPGVFDPRSFFTFENKDDPNESMMFRPVENGIMLYTGKSAKGTPAEKFMQIPGINDDPKNLKTLIGREISHNGKTLVVRHAYADEINGAFPKVQYILNPGLAAIHSYLSTRLAYENFRVKQRILTEARDQDLMVRDAQYGKAMGWEQVTDLPDKEFNGMWMPKSMARVLNGYAKAGFGSGDSAIWDNLNKMMTKLVFTTPFPHILNESILWFIQRGLRWLNPASYGRLVNSTSRAASSMLNQDWIQERMAKHGATTMYANIMTQNNMQNMAQKLGEELAGTPKPILARAFGPLGIKVHDIINFWYHNVAQKPMWWWNDFLVTQQYLEHLAEMGHDITGKMGGGDPLFASKEYRKSFEGMSDQQIGEIASGKAHAWVSDYRIPTVHLDNERLDRAAQFMTKALQSPSVLMFGRYRGGMVISAANMVKHGLGPNASKRDRIEAAGNFLAMMALGLTIQPLLNQAIQSVTGDKNAEINPAGPMREVRNVGDWLTGEKDLGEVVRGFAQPAPMLDAAMSFVKGQDWQGRKNVERANYVKHPGQAIETAGQLAGEAGTAIAPVNTISNAITSARRNQQSWGKAAERVLAEQTGVHIKTPNQQAYEADIENKNEQARQQRLNNPHNVIEKMVNALTGR